MAPFYIPGDIFMRKKKQLLVGAVNCPKTGKPYGVVLLTDRKNYYIASNAFAIPESLRSHFQFQKFPKNIKYLREYDDCPYCHKFEDLYEITNTKEKSKELRISVTEPGYDDIGKILRSMNIEYDHFWKRGFDCDVLFLNCGTADSINISKLKELEPILKNIIC